MIPNLLHVVEQTKKDFPQDWKDAHTGNANSEGFIRKLAARCFEIDFHFGLNGKRGNPKDISDDALNYAGEGADFDPTHGTNTPCTVIDVIARAGAPDAAPQWAIVTDPANPVGAAWVQPGAPPPNPNPDPPVHVCPPVPPTFPYPDENTAGKAFQERVRKTYSDAGRAFPDPNDQDAFRHFMRYGYSCRSMPEPEAANKHIKELRDQLGVP